MADPTFLIIAVVIAALFFDYTNGWNDSANAIATVVSTRVLSPSSAVMLAAALNFGGALVSTRVAKTIGGGLGRSTVRDADRRAGLDDRRGGVGGAR
jgi:PiT family inorganic phosphate transporter